MVDSAPPSTPGFSAEGLAFVESVGLQSSQRLLQLLRAFLLILREDLVHRLAALEAFEDVVDLIELLHARKDRRQPELQAEQLGDRIDPKEVGLAGVERRAHPIAADAVQEEEVRARPAADFEPGAHLAEAEKLLVVEEGVGLRRVAARVAVDDDLGFVGPGRLGRLGRGTHQDASPAGGQQRQQEHDRSHRRIPQNGRFIPIDTPKLILSPAIDLASSLPSTFAAWISVLVSEACTPKSM